MWSSRSPDPSLRTPRSSKAAYGELLLTSERLGASKRSLVISEPTVKNQWGLLILYCFLLMRFAFVSGVSCLFPHSSLPEYLPLLSPTVLSGG